MVSLLYIIIFNIIIGFKKIMEEYFEKFEKALENSQKERDDMKKEIDTLKTAMKTEMPK